MLDLFDDIYLELEQILAAIERDDLVGLLKPPPPQEFDPFKTIGKYWIMPATRSSSSLSSFSIPIQWQTPDLFNTSLSEFIDRFDNDETYEELMVTLFERHDFILKTNSIRHTAKLVKRLQDEIDEQQKYMRQLFEEMEWGGLQQLLGQDYKWKKGEIQRLRRGHYTPQSDYPESIHIRRRSATPYIQRSLALSIPDSLKVYSPTALELNRQILLPFDIKKLISISSTSASYHTPELGTEGNTIEILDDWRMGLQP